MTRQVAGPALADHINVRSFADISDVVACGLEHGGLVLYESSLGPEFFDLRTGIAGEMMQKFVNYRIPLAIVLAAPEGHGERFCELVREHRNHPLVRFFLSRAEAGEWVLR
ncbi:MAG TPA: DUF4180 domain-containing protein [Povalibacter sp.]|uniref:DUF4180 domain-containing protein n=1 Tax=Povalibacter sp. TaxID=1962978 RepID=UPI002CF08C52|nr:DUF4180 domain-containing protein [Povalibacter sp.]HMN46270.1 DUF4180 domain-containing protein [Povalibacter sp.]